MKAEAEYIIDNTRLVVEMAPTERKIQILVLTALRIRLLYHPHYPVVTDHPGDRQMYDSVRRKFY